jgi:two-component system NarL family sensor kinase
MQKEEVYIIIVAGTLLTVFMALCIVTFLFLYQRRQHRYLREKEELRSAFAQTLLESRFEIQEQTLRRISHELHDNLGQIASLIKINLNTLSFDNIGRSKDKIEDTKGLLRQLISDIKTLAVSLNSDAITRKGLVSALTAEVVRLNKIDNLSVELVTAQDIPMLGGESTIILYRMAQEILNNVIKHSAATEIRINLAGDEKHLTLSIRDNGIGFNVEQKAANGSGLGLINLYNRAAIMNASLTISSGSTGTNVNIHLPLGSTA